MKALRECALSAFAFNDTPHRDGPGSREEVAEGEAQSSATADALVAADDLVGRPQPSTISFLSSSGR